MPGYKRTVRLQSEKLCNITVSKECSNWVRAEKFREITPYRVIYLEFSKYFQKSLLSKELWTGCLFFLKSGRSEHQCRRFLLLFLTWIKSHRFVFTDSDFFIKPANIALSHSLWPFNHLIDRILLINFYF